MRLLLLLLREVNIVHENIVDYDFCFIDTLCLPVGYIGSYLNEEKVE